MKLCSRFVSQKNVDAAHEATRYLRSGGLDPPADVALDCVQLILSCPGGKLPDIQDELISNFVRQSVHVRRYFAAQLETSVTQFFDEIYDRGDNAVVCLDSIVLDTSLWQSEGVRNHCECELFQLFIAKLMESGHDLGGRSLKGITRLLAVHADNLHPLVDEEGFDVILSSLDMRLPLDVRSQATLAAAKYLEASGETGQKNFSNFVTTRVTRQRNDDLVIAFSAAAAVFPIVPSTVANLFLSEGFIQSLEPLLDKKRRVTHVSLAILELFNAACIDKACRETIYKHCSEWLSHLLSNGTDEASALAAVVLAKIRASESSSSINNSNNNGSAESNNRVQPAAETSHDLVERFKGLMAKQSADVNFKHPIEGLAYSSVKPGVKEQLSKDAAFLKGLFSILKTNASDSSILYGGFMVVWNLTRYQPNLSEEQKKMSELRAYANVSKPEAPDPLDGDEYVKDRCIAVIDAGIMPLFIECAKAKLASVQDLTSRILLSLSKYPKTRGKLAQQGAVKLLISILSSNYGDGKELNETSQNSAHALARILISVNPSHVFPASGVPQITEAVRPLLRLLSAPESPTLAVDQPRDLLPVFEALLALTNLASSPDPSAAETAVKSGWDKIEDLLLSSHSYIQRAACELVCNLMTCEKGVAKFADGSTRAGQRLHIILALADVEDLPTRQAAGGALAMLTDYDAAVAAVIVRPRGVDILLDLCSDDDEGLVHRGVVCINNLACASSGEIGQKAQRALKDGGAVDVLKNCLTKTRNPAILQSGIGALKVLMDQK